jgi:hypothetical protein
VRFKIFHLELSDSVEIDLNGRPLGEPAIRRSSLDQAALGLPGVQFELPLTNYAGFRGDNTLGIIVHKQPKRAAVPYMEELEVIVR